VAFWVRTSEVANDLDRRLLAALRDWFAADWSFDRIVFMIAEREARQAALLEEAGMRRALDATLSDGRVCRFYPFRPSKPATGENP
jgi:hypothetical protein